MKTGLILTGVLALIVLFLCGCGTLKTRVSGPSGVYHGLGYDMEKVSNGDEWLRWDGEGWAGDVPFVWPRGLLWALDAPLSLTADTLLLPADLLRLKAAEVKGGSEVGQPDGAANGSQPIRAETNRMSSTAGSRRSP